MTTAQPPPPAPPAPSGYSHAQNIFNDIDGRSTLSLLIKLNLVALLPLAVGVLFLWLPYQIYQVRGLPWRLFPEPHWGLVITVIVYTLIIFGSMAVHELIHALVIKRSGHTPILGIHRGFLSAGVPYGQFLRRNRYIMVAVAPLMSMTILGGLALLFLPAAIGQPLLIALLFNFPASLGDLLVVQRLQRHPADTLFASNHVNIFAYHSASNSG